MQNDPKGYVRTLENLPEDRKKLVAFKVTGIYSRVNTLESSKEIHVIEPFKIEDHWKEIHRNGLRSRYALVLWIARDTQGNAYVYKELRK